MKRILLFTFVFLLFFCGCDSDLQMEIPAETVCSTEVTVPSTETVPEEHVFVTENIVEGIEFNECTEPETEVLPVAVEIVDGHGIYYNNWNCTHILNDNNHYSKMSISNREQIFISSESPFGAVYFEWDEIPGEFIIAWESDQIVCGQEGFLHDYIILPEEVNQIKILFPDDSYRLLCDFRIFTRGSAPYGIQDWESPCEYADILVIPTHSDDESLFFGPLIAYYAIEREMTVQTAFMVNHAGYPERSHERLDALWELGVCNYPILGSAPDTDSRNFNECISYYSGSDIPVWQVELIRRFKPLVVVGHDLKGEYGNGGHKVNAYYLTQAVEYAIDESFDPESVSKYGVWNTPKLYLHLYRENEWMLDVNSVLSKDPLGRTSFQIAEDAFVHHKSQHRFGFHVKQTDLQPEYDCRPFGLYRSLVGQDSCADIMDHIIRSDWR